MHRTEALRGGWRLAFRPRNTRVRGCCTHPARNKVLSVSFFRTILKGCLVQGSFTKRGHAGAASSAEAKWAAELATAAAADASLKRIMAEANVGRRQILRQFKETQNTDLHLQAPETLALFRCGTLLTTASPSNVGCSSPCRREVPAGPRSGCASV